MLMRVLTLLAFALAACAGIPDERARIVGTWKIVSQWNPAPIYGNRITRGVLLWERER